MERSYPFIYDLADNDGSTAGNAYQSTTPLGKLDTFLMFFAHSFVNLKGSYSHQWANNIFFHSFVLIFTFPLWM